MMGKNTSTSYLKLLAVIIVGIVASVGIINYMGWLGGTSFNVYNQGADLGGKTGGQQNIVLDTGSCPDTKSTVLNVTLKNGEDTTADSTFDATCYFFGSQGHYISAADTTGGSVTMNCGEEYTMRCVSADGNNGDNAKITGIEQGSDFAKLNSDGTVTFTTTKANHYLKVVGSKHGVLQAKLFDIDGNDYEFAKKASPTQGAYETTGTTFVDTAANGTFSISTSDPEQQFKLFYRVNQTDTRFDDYGYWILIDMSTSEYNEPTVKLDNVLLADRKGELNTYENRQFGSTYEYAYRLDHKVVDVDHELYLDIRALDGVDPSADIVVAFAPVGAFKATSSIDVKYGATKDDSSATVVFATQTYTFDMA